MKSIGLLRVLGLIGFLLLFAPFYDHCNGHRMRQAEAPAEEAPVIEQVAPPIGETAGSETAGVSEQILDETNETAQPPSVFYTIYDFIDDDESESILQVGQLFIEDVFNFNCDSFKKGFREMKPDEIKKAVAFHTKNFCLLAVTVVSLLVLIFSLLARANRVHKLAILNLLLFLIAATGIFLEGFFEDLHQIKWGFYVFPLVQVGIIILSVKILKERLKP